MSNTSMTGTLYVYSCIAWQFTLYSFIYILYSLVASSLRFPNAQGECTSMDDRWRLDCRHAALCRVVWCRGFVCRQEIILVWFLQMGLLRSPRTSSSSSSYASLVTLDRHYPPAVSACCDIERERVKRGEKKCLGAYLHPGRRPARYGHGRAHSSSAHRHDSECL